MMDHTSSRIIVLSGILLDMSPMEAQDGIGFKVSRELGMVEGPIWL